MLVVHGVARSRTESDLRIQIQIRIQIKKFLFYFFHDKKTVNNSSWLLRRKIDIKDKVICKKNRFFEHTYNPGSGPVLI